MSDSLASNLRVASESAAIGFTGWASLMRQAAETIERVTIERDRWQATAAGLSEDMSNTEDEIERLRIAFSLAVGELSTHSSYSVWAPDQLVEQFLEEADRHGGQQK